MSAAEATRSAAASLGQKAGHSAIMAWAQEMTCWFALTVDPDKFGFCAMDCHRRVGEDAMATMHAHEVIRKSTTPDVSLRSPMRAAEAHTTLAVASTQMKP